MRTLWEKGYELKQALITRKTTQHKLKMQPLRYTKIHYQLPVENTGKNLSSSLVISVVPRVAARP